MQLFALPAETAGRSSRRIVVNADELRAHKLAAGDLVKVAADGVNQVSPHQIIMAQMASPDVTRIARELEWIVCSVLSSLVSATVVV